MPEVTGLALDVALADIESAGVDDEVEVVGGGVFGVIDQGNWEVCNQSPAPGQAVTNAPRLTVDRTCDGESGNEEVSAEPSATSSASAEEAPPPAADPSGPASTGHEEYVTAENNGDFAELLTLGDYCSPLIADFASEYEGSLIEFDGYIGAMNNHAGYETRYDILIGGGDFNETAAPGPAFQFRDVNIVYDLHLDGPNIPDTIGVGQNLHLVAEVGEYEERSCLFLLEPISTQVR